MTEPTQELVDFATYFSEKYLELPPDNYFSDPGVYFIEYLGTNPAQSPKNFDVSERSKHFYFSKEALVDYNKNFVFYMIIWMGFHLFNFRKYRETDKLALDYYLKTGRSKKDLISGWLKTLDNQMPITELNYERTKYIEKTLSVIQ